MLTSFKRSLAAGSAVVIALLGLPAAPAADAAPAAADAAKAANYLVRNLPNAKDDAGVAASAALGLATMGDCTYAAPLRTLVAGLETQARTYTKDQPARAAKLSITVSALGLNPKNFGGVNLVSAVTKKLPADGRIGSSDSAFSQSLAIIALKRAGATIPVTLLTKLLSQQDDSGAFGYEWPTGTFNADWDTTALAINALTGLGHLQPQVDSAVTAAQAARKADGYWDSFSPVDSTSLMGAAMAAAGQDVTTSKNWLATQQAGTPDGGLPAELNGTSSDVLATSEAMFLATGRNLLDASLKLSGCPKNPKRLPASTTVCEGVWVVVDRDNGQDSVRCATKYATGVGALRSAGLEVGLDKSTMVNRINGFPRVIPPWTPETKGWVYWHATQNADGTWGAWKVSDTGAATSKPAKGVAEGWWFTTWPGDDATTNAFPLPPLGYETAPVPTITGTAVVGQVLTVEPGTWTPAPTTVSARWYRSGSPIPGANKSTYKLVKADLHRAITVKITVSKGGYQTASKTSLPTAKVTR